ncbi:TonB-dependent receptor [Novosphingobium sp. SG707]|uniref:TonB-dependent receptor n=1 Tax=Novosphingobium sp. SG707 TaxID=2586996 RepID=UPI001446FB0C|nr:TonB-dependent receptor [Novosphingobium sp. SG707]NKJ00547.1 iron complex outermembrane receptor protein [Novosphingobium sp. SG707]
MKLRQIFLTSVASAGLFASPVFAEDAAPAAEAAADQVQAEAPGDIVVTARHRSESAQSVPLAISVLGGLTLERTGAFNVNRLQQLAPTLQFYSSNPRNSAANLRGLGAPFGLTNDGIEQGVGIYVDDVYFSRAAASTFDFLDAGQIEVLRGPQGTLYGKNTTAGAINITSRAPTFNFESRGEISVGNYGYRQLKLAVSGPLSETVAARIAVSSTGRGGTIYNTTTKSWVQSQDNLGLRGQILWRPSATVDVTLAADYNEQNPSCCATVYYGYGSTQRSSARQFPALANLLGYTPASTNPYARVTDLDSELRATNRIGGASLKIKTQVGAGTFTSITAWRFWDWNPSNDRDYTGLPITTLSQNPTKQEQYTQEFRYSLSTSKFDWNVGLFAFNQAVHTTGTQQQGSAASRFLLSSTQINAICPTGSSATCVPDILNGLTAKNDIRLNNTSLAAFSQLSWKVTDRFTIQPGVRLNYDQKKGWYNSVVNNSAGTQIFPSSGTGANSLLGAQAGVLSSQQFPARYSAWNFSYDLTLSYALARDVRAYATYAKTFKSGGVNLNGVPSDANGQPILAAATVKPETVNHFELGFKSQWLDRKVTVNLAAFRTTIDNFQAQVTNGALGVLRGYLANAEQVRTQGLEGDFSVRPSDRFSAYLNAALTDAKYRKFTTAPCPPELSGGTTVTGTQTPGAAGVPGALSPASCDISGQRLPGVSKYALSWGGEYNVPAQLFGKDGEVYVGYDASYRSSWSSNASASIYTWVKGYSLHNFRAGWRQDRGIDIYGWVRNATGINYVEMLTVASGNTGLIAANLGDPRTYGATVKFEF